MGAGRDSAAAPQLPEYERRRNSRIAENKRRLDALKASCPGLLGDHPPLRAGVAKRARKPKRQPAADAVPRPPLRRSTRARPSTPPSGSALHVDDDSHAVLELLAQPVRQCAPRNGDPAGMDEFSRMRCATMSARALSTRIVKVTRVDKMESFVRVLREGAAGEDSAWLLEEAESKLAALTGRERGR